MKEKGFTSLFIIVGIVILITVVIGGFYFWKPKTQKTVTNVTSPNVANPVERVESANPYDKTNPFSNIKVNPFE